MVFVMASVQNLRTFLFYFDANIHRQIRFASGLALRSKKGTATTDRNFHFVDWCAVRATAGRGGNGACSFLQLWCNPNAGPDGGDGGNGGHIIFKASKTYNSLAHVQSVYLGQPGEKGSSKDCIGKSAEHTIIEVPVGTFIKNDKNKIVADLDKEGQFFLAARGGAGGKGNHFFLSNELRAPLISEEGAEGESKQYTIELKLIANVGLIGFPNAGKSTLLRAISRARPKVAAYPFTTLNPTVGIIHFDDFVQLSVADMPGLIPDAHKNRGLGISFLRHIERCSCLLYVIDLSVENPWEQLERLKYELEMYQKGLTNRFEAVVGNKVDLEESVTSLKIWKKTIDIPILPISAKKGHNVTFLVNHLRSMYDKHKEKST